MVRAILAVAVTAFICVSLTLASPARSEKYSELREELQEALKQKKEDYLASLLEKLVENKEMLLQEESADAPEQEADPLGCKLSVQNVVNKAKDILTKTKNSVKDLGNEVKLLANCLKLKPPTLIGQCAQTHAQNIMKKVENQEKIAEQDVQDLEKQLSEIPEKCVSAGETSS